MKYQMLLLMSFMFVSISQFGKAQTVDTAYFLNSTQPLMVKIEGEAYTSNTDISRVVKSTNGLDSVFIDVYWKHCYPAFNGFEPYDTIIELNIITPSTFDLRIDSYEDTNTNTSCAVVDSVELLFQYDLANNTSSLGELEIEEKQLMKVVNLMGNETKDESNAVLIYIYNDGTRKKVFHIKP